MDDLLGEDWQSQPSRKQQPAVSNYTSPNLPNIKAISNPSRSGNASPLNLSRPSSTLNGSSKSSGPAGSGGDAFGSLLGGKKQAASSNMSMLDRQRQLMEDKRRQQEEQGKLWDTLGSGSVSRSGTPSAPAQPLQPNGKDEDDILAAFNKSAPVNKASHFPPPSSGLQSGVDTGTNTPITTQVPVQTLQGQQSEGLDDDDDPFGLNEVKPRNGYAVTPTTRRQDEDDDDILGDLGRPASAKPPTRPAPPRAPSRSPSPPVEANNENRPLTELTEMGFPEDTARIALLETNSNVQAAVGWLLEQAHAESQRKAKEDNSSQSRRRSPLPERVDQRRQSEQEQGAMPAWMREERRASPSTRRQDSRSPATAGGEKDASQIAQEYGSKFLKGANSFWKSSQKQVAKTLREFQEGDTDPNQPKWMRDGATPVEGRSSRQHQQQDPSRSNSGRSQPQENLTNEAALLDAPRQETIPSRSRRQQTQQDPPRGTGAPRSKSPFEPQPQRNTPQPRFMQQQPPSRGNTPVQKLSRQVVEDESAQAYVSPARRKRPTPQPPPAAEPEPEVDLFSPAPVKSSAVATPRNARVSRPSPAITPRPQAPPRSVPSVSPSALASSAQQRKIGGEAFKRGDFAAAHDHYTAALTPLPAAHPILIIVLANRALTGIKIGDAKVAVSDCDRALEIIGPSQGTGETIELGGGEGVKEMRESFGKIIARKAEALEHLEKWKDAAAVWRQAIEAGVGGPNALKGRDRCEKAANPTPKGNTSTSQHSKAPAPRKSPPAKSLGNSLQRPTISNVQSAEAVKKLREANAAAEKADDEKFALTDAVDAKLNAWKGGKADNLRALLQSMDTVLWEGAGWKKVGMSDLVMPNKVKIVYMKAIGKVHPDKIPQDATTEQRMVSAAVFATLNEAWDKFKTDNNL